MATSLVPPPGPPSVPPVPPEDRAQEQLIERKLGMAQRHVWWVEGLSLLAIWAAGVLGLLLVAALFDHLIGLGVFGRLIFWLLFVGGSLYGLIAYGGPLLVRQINPLYAARTIEEARPALKNSLVNFLLLRRERHALKEVIYQAVQQQAASDIEAVPVETTIDRSRLIYAGYVLCGVMAAVAAYKILSPKDPFATAARVLAPWADIPRPSRVEIVQVEPGSVEVYRGQTVKVSATLRGVRSTDRLEVLFSTVDGQLVDQAVPLVHSVGDRYEAMLPPGADSAGDNGGLGQDATYRIVAGDAESRRYRLTVLAAPRIAVRRLEYAFPAYTRKPPQVVTETGDIRALEGTRVTLHAQANHPIRSAWIEFDPEGGSAAQTLPLQAEGHAASGQLLLQLREDRRTPRHAAYQLRFIDQHGGRSQQPIVHRIEVVPDLPPEIDVLQPRQAQVEVPEDGELTIEVRAIDPDFGLSGLRLEGQAPERAPLRVELLPLDADQPPQVVVPFVLQPRAHGLRAGDELKWTVVAEDNRVHPLSGQAEPNVARSPTFTLVVLPPQRAAPSPQQPPHAGGETPDQTSRDQGKKIEAPSQKPPPGQRRSEPPSDDKVNQPPPDGRDASAQPSPEDRQPAHREPPEAHPQREDHKREPSPPSHEATNNEKNQKNKDPGDQGHGDAVGQNSSSGKGDSQDGSPKGGQEEPRSGDKPGVGGNPQTRGRGDDAPPERAGQQAPRDPSDREHGRTEVGGEARPDSSSGSGAGRQGEKQEESQTDAIPSPDQVRGVERGQPGRGKAHEGQAVEEFLKELARRGVAFPPSEPASEEGGAAGAERAAEGTAQKSGAGRSVASSPEEQSRQGVGRGPGETAQETAQQGPARGAEQAPSTGRGLSDRGMPDQELRGPDARPAVEEQAATRQEEQSASQGAGSGKEGREGAGGADRQSQGSAGAGVRENRDVPKNPLPDEGDRSPGEPSPESNSKRQSDSRGSQSGDESGGGKAGAGQPSPQPGRDSAGSQTPSEEGAGTAREAGQGDVGPRGGQGPAAEAKTGAVGQAAGRGSATRPDDPAGRESGSQPPGQVHSQPSPRDASQEPRRPDPSGASASDQPVGGSDGGLPRFQTPNRTGVDPEADRAHLEYARRATEMVLRHLRDEAHRPDPELLERLGWTPEDLAEFVRRWESLVRGADESPAGRRELDEALRSLGLRDPTHRKRAGGNVGDQQRDLRDAGGRSAPPPAYRELFDAFRRGAGRAGNRP